MASAAPLLGAQHCRRRRCRAVLASALAAAVLLLAVGSLLSGRPAVRSRRPNPRPSSRGAREGVSEKSSGAGAVQEEPYPWSNDELRWQRTAFHFQPVKNWMNDPNGPMYYKGWYHLFYQWNPYSAVWGNITWGHAVSRDLIHWLYLPLALVPDRPYDANGVWTGSATLLPSGLPVVLYTGSTLSLVQVQNLAVPADPSDPLLLNWTKSPSNPVLRPPPGIALQDFRDPTTAWQVPSDPSAWRLAIGSKDASHAGIVLVYRTMDFVEYELLQRPLHRVPGTGMWECVDFYPVNTLADEGLDMSVEGGGVRHVLKASLDDDKHDYYAIGMYDEEANTWKADDAERDVGLGLRYDYGKYYASKTFYDPARRRRVLFGWIGETDSENADLLKGWASVQSIPRTVVFDRKTGRNLLQWPVEEVESLRLSSKNFTNVEMAVGSVVPLDLGEAIQLDVTAEFQVDESALEATREADIGYNCSTSGGAHGRGMLGPFGLLVLADEELTEKTAVYFYVAKDVEGKLTTFICQDDLRSSLATDLIKRVYGSTVPVLDGEKLTIRLLIDHSILETYAQGGRTCITSRVYPTTIIHGGARLFLFNNATGASVTATSVNVWQMNSAFIRPFPGQFLNHKPL